MYTLNPQRTGAQLFADPNFARKHPWVNKDGHMLATVYPSTTPGKILGNLVTKDPEKPLLFGVDITKMSFTFVF